MWNVAFCSDVPLESWNGNVTVTRQGAYVFVNTSYGVNMHCDSVNQLCVLNIHGWYHNRTLGLLGTNDNEPANDFRMRNQQLTSNIYHFINSYEVSGLRQCRPDVYGDNVITQRPVCSSQHIHHCTSIFSSSKSSLNNCFSRVDPTPFLVSIVLSPSTKYDIPRKCKHSLPPLLICTTSYILWWVFVNRSPSPTYMYIFQILRISRNNLQQLFHAVM